MTSCSVTSRSILCFLGNIDFPADDQGSCCIREGLVCVFIVCEKMFKIGESRAIPCANEKEQETKKLAGNPRRRRFSTETPLENAD